MPAFMTTLRLLGVQRDPQRPQFAVDDFEFSDLGPQVDTLRETYVDFMD